LTSRQSSLQECQSGWTEIVDLGDAAWNDLAVWPKKGPRLSQMFQDSFAQMIANPFGITSQINDCPHNRASIVHCIENSVGKNPAQ